MICVQYIAYKSVAKTGLGSGQNAIIQLRKGATATDVARDHCPEPSNSQEDGS